MSSLLVLVFLNDYTIFIIFLFISSFSYFNTVVLILVSLSFVFILVYFVSSNNLFFFFFFYSFSFFIVLGFIVFIVFFYCFYMIFLRDSPAREKATQFSIVRIHLKERRKWKCSEGVWNYSELRLQESLNKDKIITEASKHPKLDSATLLSDQKKKKLTHFLVWHLILSHSVRYLEKSLRNKVTHQFSNENLLRGW